MKYKVDTKEYINVHNWIYRNYGKAFRCDNPNCNFLNPKQYEWAKLKDKKYERKIENFIQLCPSCHHKYDETKSRREKISKSHIGNTFAKKAPVIQLKDNQIIKKWRRIKDASEGLDILMTSIVNCCKGRTKTAGGFNWKYDI